MCGLLNPNTIKVKIITFKIFGAADFIDNSYLIRIIYKTKIL